MSSIPDDVFAGMTSLKRVNFSGSALTTVGGGAFRGTALNVLDLSKNLLSAVPSSSLRACAQPPVTLDLSENRISRVGSGDFSQLRLHALNLSSNPITTVESGAFTGARVDVLDLHNTSLQSLPASMESFFTSSHAVVYLHLNSNWVCDCDELWLGRYVFNTQVNSFAVI
jgi:Leucine-rich repeat (LRR) protein